MSLTAAGKNVVGALQEYLASKGDNAECTVKELAEAQDLKQASIRGSLNKLIKDGYVVSEEREYETDDGETKKYKALSLTAAGWEADVNE